MSVSRTSLLTAALVLTLAGVGWRACVSPGPAEAADKGGGKKIAAPEFTKVTAWVNSKPLEMAKLRGKVVVVHFFASGCINCVNNYPHYRAWQEKYKDGKDVALVGIHTPEFDGEKNLKRLEERAKKNDLTFPIAADNDWANWKAWGNRYWPCVYLVDKKGDIRRRWEGELGAAGYKELTAEIDALAKE